jgi:hypothetical protein
MCVYGLMYLRAPNEEDIVRLMAENECRGWLGMLDSIDCMHWAWKNSPNTWQGLYCSRTKELTIVLEAVASQDLWICHIFCGLPGSLNDINVAYITSSYPAS